MSTTVPNEGADIRTATLMFAAVAVAVAALYLETFVSIIKTWNFDGYSHGFIVLPICLYLVWRERRKLSDIVIARSYLGIAALFALSVLWWLADNLGIQVVRQFAVVSMLPVIVLAIFGLSFANALRFALAYLFFAVPFGEFFIPYLMDFTATFSVGLLSLLGIPVFQDGQYFHVPSGSYEVAKACAGLRYIVATLALALLYGHILFTSARKTALFVAFSVALAIATNGIRATTIVLLLHYTDLDIAAGQDHEFVGWILYGLMIILIIGIGQKYADPVVVDDSKDISTANSNSGNRMQSGLSLVSVVIVAVFAVSTGPVLNIIAGSVTRSEIILTAGLPSNVVGWTAAAVNEAEWRPDYSGYSQMSLGRYVRGGDKVDVAFIRYLGQEQGAEITSAANFVADPNEWKLGDVGTIGVDTGSLDSYFVSEVIASRDSESRLIWFWTEVGGILTNGVLQTKVTEIRNMLSGNPSVSSAFILAVLIDSSAPDSRQILRDFLTAFYVKSRNCVIPDSDHALCSLDAPGGKET